MENKFEAIFKTRNNFEKLVNSQTEEKLTKIPDGFKNNVLWNFGHVIATQQLLTYGRCGLEFKVDKSFVESFMKGTMPEAGQDDYDIGQLLELSKSTLENLKKDYESGLFKGFQSYETSFGVCLNSIEDALDFIPIHESLHLGYALAMRRNWS